MSKREKKDTADLLSLMTDAQGGVMPHGNSVRLASAPGPHAHVMSADATPPVQTASPSATSQPDPEVASEVAHVAQRQAERRRLRRAARHESRSEKRPQSLGSGTPIAPVALIASEVHYLTVQQVARRFGVGVATIWRWSSVHPEFPKPVRPGPGVTRWPLEEIADFEARLKADR